MMDLLNEFIKVGLRYLSTEEGAKLITQTINRQFTQYRTCPKCLHTTTYHFKFCPYCGKEMLDARAKREVRMKSYVVELHKVKKEEVKAEDSLDLIEQVKRLFPDYEMYWFKLTEEHEFTKADKNLLYGFLSVFGSLIKDKPTE